MIRTAVPRTDLTLAEALRRLQWEADHGTVDTGRYRCRYVAWGDGPPLVMVHGLGDGLESLAMPMALLSREFRCIAYDQPTGRRDGARVKSYGHADLVHDLFALVDHLKLRQTALLGYSYGSTVAVAALHDRPDRFSRGILVGGFAHRPLTKTERWLAWLGRYWVGRIRHLPFRDTVFRRVHYAPFASLEPEVWDYFMDHYGRPPVRTVAHWAHCCDATDVRPLLESVRQPVLLVCGDDDPLVPHYHQEHFMQHLPRAVMFQIERCGHYPMFTHPHALAEAVRRFLHPAACVFSNGALATAECLPHSSAARGAEAIGVESP